MAESPNNTGGNGGRYESAAPLDLKERRAVTKSMEVPGWFAGLPKTTRKAIMQKLIKALKAAKTPRDISSLTKAIFSADRLDALREEQSRAHGENTSADELAKLIRQDLESMDVR